MLHATSAYEHDQETAVANNPDWMANLPDQTMLSQVSLPGTHDTMARFGGFAAKTQSMTLQAQLDSGIRFLDIRTDFVKGDPKLKNHCKAYDSSTGVALPADDPSDCTFQIYHGPTYQQAEFRSDVLDVAIDFLDQHPTETIVMRLRREANRNGSGDRIKEFFSTHMNSLLGQPQINSRMLTNSSCSNRLSVTLGSGSRDCDARGKIVIFHENWGAVNKSVFSFDSTSANSPNLEQQNEFNITTVGGMYKKWEAIQDHLDLTDSGLNATDFSLNYLSANFGLGPFSIASGHSSTLENSPHLPTVVITDDLTVMPDFPRVNCTGELCTIVAEGMNILTMEHLNSRAYSRVGMIAADFPGAGLIESIINVNEFAAAPVLQYDAIPEINEGGVASLRLKISDENLQDTFTVRIGWRDPNSPGIETFAIGASATGEQEILLTHSYLDGPGPSQLEVAVFDSSSLSDYLEIPVTVRNVAPTISFDDVMRIDEDGIATLTGTIVDPGVLDNFTLDINWGHSRSPDNEPTFNFPARQSGTQNFTLTHRYLDNPDTGFAQVTATIKDKDGGEQTVSTEVYIDNVAPVVQFDSAPAIDENGVVTLSGTITDPGTLDTFQLDIDWGDSLSTPNFESYLFNASVTGTQSFEFVHQYLDDNPSGSSVDSYSISAIVSDNDRGVGSATTTVQVSNLAPTLTLDDITAKSDDGHVSVAGVYADVGTLDTHTAIVDWGDGTAPEPINLDELAGTVSGSHEYTRGGVFPITVTLTDDDGGMTTATTAATVQGVGLVGGTLYVIGTDVRDTVNVSLYGSNLRVQARLGGGALTTTWVPESSIQSIHILGCDGHDDIRLSPLVTQDAMMDGGEGNDILYTAKGNDVVIGGPGNDTIRTYDGDDTVDGGDGIDRIWTYQGDDDIDAGDGNNYVYAGDGNNVVVAGTGNDFIQTGIGDDAIHSGDGIDNIRSGAGNDFIDAGDGNDVVRAGAGDDIVVAGDGDDTVYGQNGLDFLIGGLGADRIYGGNDDDLLIAGTTDHDQSTTGLQAIPAEWTSGNGYTQRVSNIRSGATTLGFALDPTTSAHDDTSVDRLYGESGRDWFFASLNDTSVALASEEFDQI